MRQYLKEHVIPETLLALVAFMALFGAAILYAGASLRVL
jgi:hypothetical protein